MAAVTQIRFRHTEGRAYYDRKIAEGKSGKEAIRALKRRISDALYTRLRHDAEQTAGVAAGPGGHSGNDFVACAAGSHPEHQLFGQATPGPDHHTTTRRGSTPSGPEDSTTTHYPKKHLTQRGLDRERSDPPRPARCSRLRASRNGASKIRRQKRRAVG